MVMRKRPASAKLGLATAFGTAMSSLFVVPEIQADITDLTFNNGLTFTNIEVHSILLADPSRIDFDTVVGNTDMTVFNTFFSNAQGEAVFYSHEARMNNPLIEGIAEVFLGQSLDPETFLPNASFQTFGGAITDDVTRYFGIRTSEGNVAWFTLDFSEFDLVSPGNWGGGCIDLYGGFEFGEFGNEGETLVVGGTPPILLGDINCDGLVDLLDINPFVELLANGEFSVKADFNNDGALNLLDMAPFIEALGGG